MATGLLTAKRQHLKPTDLVLRIFHYFMTRKILHLPIRVVRKLLQLAEPALARVGSRNCFWARIYYAFLNPGYAQEQMAFLAGRLAYAAAIVCPEGNLALLRRNVHRIEKGLLMRPRRVPFALDYIGVTVDALGVARSAPHMDPMEIQWSHDVLAEYFAISPPYIEFLIGPRQRFLTICPPAATYGVPLTPYQRDLNCPIPVTYEALLALAVRRRSVRWFLQKPVPHELIDRAIQLGCLAPSACNRQPFEFRVFDEPEFVQQVIHVPYGLVGYGHNVPCIAVIVGKQRNYFSERDRHLIYIDASLAAMGFLFGLETQGLSSCCVNWPEIEENNLKMANLLNLAPDERPIMLIAIGYPDPDGMVARSTKKSLSSTRRYNFER